MSVDVDFSGHHRDPLAVAGLGEGGDARLFGGHRGLCNDPGERSRAFR
jgi:hypothetical protein